MLNNMYYVLSYNCHEHDVHEHKKLYSFCLICNFAEISNQSTGYVHLLVSLESETQLAIEGPLDESATLLHATATCT